MTPDGKTNQDIERADAPDGWQNLQLASIMFSFNFIRYTESPTPAVLHLREMLSAS